VVAAIAGFFARGGKEFHPYFVADVCPLGEYLPRRERKYRSAEG
jgi:hypothetical protein